MLHYTHAMNLIIIIIIFTCLQHEDMSVTIFERIYRGIGDEYLKIIELDEDKDPKDYVIEFVTNLIKGMKVCN